MTAHTPERSLWAAVLHHAMLDALFDARKMAKLPPEERQITPNMAYVTQPNSNCSEVCRNANIEPAWFYIAARKRLEDPRPHRAVRPGDTVVQYDGKSLTLAEWSVETGIPCRVLIYRKNSGWTPKEMLTTPQGQNRPELANTITTKRRTTVVMMRRDLRRRTPELPAQTVQATSQLENQVTQSPKKAHRPPKTYTYDGHTMTMPEWSAVLGIPAPTLYYRLKRGWTVEQTLSRPRYWRERKAPKPTVLAPSKPRKAKPHKPTALAPSKPRKAKPHKPKRTPKTYTHADRTLTLSQWADVLGINKNTLRTRIAMGWPIDEVFGKPLNPPLTQRKVDERLPDGPKRKLYTYADESLTIHEWAERFGIKLKTLRNRLYNGYSLADALTAPVGKRTKTKDLPTYTYQGQTRPIEEWAEITGIKLQTLKMRLWRGATIEQALTAPMRKSATRQPDEVQP